MDEKEAEARPVMGTIFLVLVVLFMTILAFGKGSVQRDYGEA